tara:strand:+ start:6108 stop:6422 length:315 start_codon:yes stop_codon:yes gene_type:complete
MDNYLNYRRGKLPPRLQVNSRTAITPWYHDSAITKAKPATKHGHLSIRKFNASETKKEDASESDSASSESDGEGGRKKKKKRCWDGYKPTPGVEPYAPGSCEKA